MAHTTQHRTSFLQKCGFEKKGSGRAPEEKYIFLLKGEQVAYTSLPKGRKEIKKGTFRSILKQVHLSQQQYNEFYSCKKGRQDHIEILQNLRNNGNL